MLQIIGQSMLIATRMDGWPDGRRHDASARPQPEEAEAPRSIRRGWLNMAGILL